jgi:phospholipase C
MGFYDVQHGDMPYFKMLADQYALGDNYHQPVKGGTAANSVYLGYGAVLWYTDANGNGYGAVLWYTDANGNPGVPPPNQIENPNPQPGTTTTRRTILCPVPTRTAPIRSSRVSRPSATISPHYTYAPKPNCQNGRYYMLNNLNPGFNGDGTRAALGPKFFRIPPQSQRSIANSLDEARVSWTYYGEQWNAYVAKSSPLDVIYCKICNPFRYQAYFMTNPTKRKNNLKDTSDLYTDLQNGVLPAVSWVKPRGAQRRYPFDLQVRHF